MASKKIKFTPKNGHCMSISRHWDSSRNLWRDPSHRVHVEYIDIVKALFAIIASKHVEFPADSGHGVAGPGWWLLATDLGLAPDKTGSIEHIEIIKPRIPIVPAMEVYFLPVNGRRVVVSTGWGRTKCFWLVILVLNVAHVWRRLRHWARIVYWRRLTKSKLGSELNTYQISLSKSRTYRSLSAFLPFQPPKI